MRLGLGANRRPTHGLNTGLIEITMRECVLIVAAVSAIVSQNASMKR